MNYQKQMKKQKRKQMAIEKQKQQNKRDSAYGSGSSGASWKTVLGFIIIGYLVFAFNSPADAAHLATTASFYLLP